jgi:hypothetical protein
MSHLVVLCACRAHQCSSLALRPRVPRGLRALTVACAQRVVGAYVMAEDVCHARCSALDWLSMRPPSRTMPKALRRASIPVVVLAWAALLAMFGGYGYEFWQHPIAIGILSAVVAAVILRNKRQTKRHLAELANERTGESICEFTRAFDVRNTDTWVIRAVYEQVQHQLRWCSPIFPCAQQTASSRICDWIPTISTSTSSLMSQAGQVGPHGTREAIRCMAA